MCIRDRGKNALDVAQALEKVSLKPVVERVQDPTMQLGYVCLLYTSDAADERSSVDLVGLRIIKKKKNSKPLTLRANNYKLNATSYSNTHTSESHVRRLNNRSG